MTSATLIAAQARREAARERLRGTLATLQERLSPAAIGQGAVQTVRDTATNVARTGAETARAHPGKIAAGIGLVGLFLARKPIARAIQRQETSDETDEFGA